MRSNTHPLHLGIVLTRLLKLAALVSGVLLTTSGSCLIPQKTPAAQYDPANRGNNGEFVIQGGNYSGRATLPPRVPYYTTIPEFKDREAPVREWVYRHKWQDGERKWHYTDWKSLGKDGQGNPVCELIVRPPEGWDATLFIPGASYHFVCETRARYQTLDGKREKEVDIPIPVTLTVPED